MLKIALSLIAVISLLFVFNSQQVHASPPSGLNTTQFCGANGTADITFNWRGVGSTSRQVWIDLTTNDNWRTGTYISAGPFTATDTAFTWTGITANKTHYYRLTEQLSSGAWVPSVTSSFKAACATASSSSATPEEQSYRNRATAQLTALAVRIQQNPKSSRVTLIATFNDFVTTLNGLEPAPPRFRAAHIQLRDTMQAFVDCARGGGCSQSDLEDLADELIDSLDDYQLVVGITF
jgi:hypothetical protein